MGVGVGVGGVQGTLTVDQERAETAALMAQGELVLPPSPGASSSASGVGAGSNSILDSAGSAGSPGASPSVGVGASGSGSEVDSANATMSPQVSWFI